MEKTARQRQELMRSYATATAVIIAVLGSVFLFLWLSGNINNIQFGRFELLDTKFNTSILLIFSAIALWLTVKGNSKAAIGLSLFVCLCSFVTLYQFASATSLGIDQLFVSDPYEFEDFPGRTSVNSLFAFLCCATVLLILNSGRAENMASTVAVELLSIIALVLSMAALIGRVEHIEFAYSFGSKTHMSSPVAVMFILLSTGLMALLWSKQETKIARIPTWIPALLCFGVLLLDSSTPFGLNVGICYIPLVFCGLWFNRPHMTFIFAAVSSGLSIFGYYIKPPGDLPEWMTFTNRLITIAALWFVAVLVFMQKRSEANLLNYTRRLERSNQELDDFAYIASHDLKEPLRGLFNHSTFLQEDYSDKLDKDGQRRLERLSLLCQRMERLVNDLLYYSRLGRGELAIQKISPSSVIQEIKQMMEDTLKEKKIQLITRPMPDVVCDKPRITEVFRNLITNAIKYNNNPEPFVEIGWAAPLSAFYVKDNGMGIDKEFHSEIFRIFKRLNPAEENDNGTGVGLTFVKKIVERHNGRIWVESELGKGATFYFTLSDKS